MLYAFTRRAAIELVVSEAGGEPTRVAQAERARTETDRWLERESLLAVPRRRVERSLFEATSGSWPREAINDAMWRKESLGVLLWALHHLDPMPDAATEFDQGALDDAITRYGSVSSFRANGVLRGDDQIEEAWLEADAWFGATEGRTGEDATARLHRRRAVPGAQLAARRRRRTSMTTHHTTAMRAIGIR